MTIGCKEALTRIYEYLDGELDGVSHEQVEEHFRVCTRCYPHLRLEERFLARVREALARSSAPADLERRVLDLLDRETD